MAAVCDRTTCPNSWYTAIAATEMSATMMMYSVNTPKNCFKRLIPLTILGELVY
jgi:hypothetical protein